MDNTGGGLRRFCAIIGNSLLTGGLNSDQLSFTPLSEVKAIEIVCPGGRQASTWS
jgi:hypothetical protein